MPVSAPIIIIGSGRSGSSILNAILGSHPDIMMLGETRFMIPRVWDALWGCDGNSVQRGLTERFLADTAGGPVSADISDSHKQLGEELKSLELERTGRVLRSAIDDWFCISSSNKRHWGFKEIWNSGDVDWATYDLVFPEALWVNIVRHPLRFVAACARFSGRALDNAYLFDLLLQWKKTVEKSRERRSTGRYFEVRYEDLCSGPRQTLSPLFSTIDLPWNHRCSEALRRQHGPKTPFANDAQPEMRGLIEKIGLGGLMQELGYACAPQSASPAPASASLSAVGRRDICTAPDNNTTSPSLVSIGAACRRLLPPFPRESGNAWEFAMPSDCGVDFGRYADDVGHWTRSPLEMFEDGRPLGQAHALHEHIRVIGGGGYSHWRERLLFSTSDNSDPNMNGREYSICLLSDDTVSDAADRVARRKDRLRAFCISMVQRMASITLRGASRLKAAVAGFPDGAPAVDRGGE